MSNRHSVDMTGIQNKLFRANPNRDGSYHATIHNLSGQTLNVTVTNQNAQNDSPLVFDTPAGGAVSIVDGAIGEITEPYQAWSLDLTVGNGTGFIHITEAG